MTRTSRPGRTNGGSPALSLFMLLIAVFLCLISLQIATLDALVKVGAIEDDKYVEALVVQWTEERRGRCVVQTQGVFCAEDAA